MGLLALSRDRNRAANYERLRPLSGLCRLQKQIYVGSGSAIVWLLELNGKGRADVQHLAGLIAVPKCSRKIGTQEISGDWRALPHRRQRQIWCGFLKRLQVKHKCEN